MMRMEQQMSNGVSQREACQDWGMQFRTDSYQKLSLILIQSFTKGGREAAMLMEAEEREAFHKRIDRAKKRERRLQQDYFSNDFIIVSGNVIGDVPGTDSLSGF